MTLDDALEWLRADTDDLIEMRRLLIAHEDGLARDLAIVLPQTVNAIQAVDIIKQSAGPLLETLNIFDVYTGEQVPPSMKSLAFGMTFRAERTLTDSEVDDSIQNVIKNLEKNLSAKIRD